MENELNEQLAPTTKKNKKPRTPMSAEKKIRLVVGGGIGAILLLQIFTMAQLSSLGDRQVATVKVMQQEFTKLKESTEKLSQDKDNLNVQFKQLSDVIVNESGKTQADIQTLGQQFNGLKQQLNDINKNISQNRDAVTQMQSRIDALKTNAQGTSAAPITATSTAANNLQTSDQFRIFKVASYGVVLQNTQGVYTIATIGRSLPNLGTITEITQDRVIVGDTQIIANPSGFKLDQVAATQAYRISN